MNEIGRYTDGKTVNERSTVNCGNVKKYCGVIDSISISVKYCGSCSGNNSRAFLTNNESN